MIGGKIFDVAVVGGGTAGCAAAVSAARAGLRTILLERSAILGGLATNGLVNWWEPMCDGMGVQLIGGIAEEMLQRALAYGGGSVPACWRQGVPDAVRRRESAGPKENGRYVSWFSPTRLAVVLLAWLKEEGVEVVLDALLTDVRVRNGCVSSLLFATQSGMETVRAKRYIDATGSCEIFFRGGFPTCEGRNALSYVVHVADGRSLRKWHYIGDAAPWNAPDKSGFVAGITREEVNRILQNGQLRLYEEIAAGKLTGEVVALPAMPQFRTIRRIEGAYTLTGADANRHFADSLCVGGDFERRGVWYEIPYRSFYLRDAGNAVAAGRVISATGAAWGAVRVIPFAALTGEVSALIAALSLQSGADVGALDAEKLRAAVHRRGLLTCGTDGGSTPA
ncbi:MAG TPA: FAD-dependent oxidoreductase [Firmicutes bacterium]|nr:FAD-dependent oxidoreductase [Bacillota bacterium]